MKNNKLLYILGIVTIAALIAAFFVAKNRKNNSAKEVELQTVATRTIIQTVTASGKIYPEEEVKISSDVSGEIIDLYVKEGDVVKKGQLLARIKPESYQAVVEQSAAQLDNTKAQLSTSKARIAQAKAIISQAEAQFETAKAAYTRAQELFTKKIISKADLESAEASYKTTKATVESAKADLEAAKHTSDAASYTIKATEAMIKEAKINLNKTTIYAPMDGIISLLNVKKGEKVVGTLQMSGTEMMRIANFENMEVRVDVSEGEITKVKLNDTATIEVDAYLDRKFTGIVTQVANSSKGAGSSMVSADQSTNFVVKIRILKSSYEDLLSVNQKPFLPGMSATVDVRTQTKTGVVAIPIQAVTTKDSVYNGSNHTKEIVYIKQADKAKLLEVKTGIQDDSYIEIVKGLSGNETIITGPYNTISKDLKDGDKVIELDKTKKKETKKEDEKEDK
ncbi:MAG TPA: efflux RND transporter periplasmic adaptor subunit [Chitinophagales bacterium]|jgi:HlyD family secretion protein|nr:efflux RND transporter periplasmic adaptor subunit [Chitinophagales bacterium]